MYIAKVVRRSAVLQATERYLRIVITQRSASSKAVRETARRSPALTTLCTGCIVSLAMGCSVYESLGALENGHRASPTAAASWMPKHLESEASSTADASTAFGADASTASSTADASIAPAKSLVPSAPPVTKQAPPVAQVAADLDAGSEIEAASQPDAAVPAADSGVRTQPTGPIGSAAQSCTRAGLLEDATQYLEALASGDKHKLALHPNARYTENGALETLGRGLWLNRPKTEFARHVLDESSCSSATEAVLRENAGRVVLGLRLRYVDHQLLEVEAQVVRSNDAYWDPDQIIVSGPDAWVEPLPDKQRSSSAELLQLAMNYFASASDVSLLPPHADTCKRRQNGALMPNKGSCGAPGTQRFLQQRYPLVDETAGVVTAVIKYSDYIGMYLFKVSGGSIQDIEVLGGASSTTTGW